MINKISSQLFAETVLAFIAAVIILACPVSLYAAEVKPFVPIPPILR